MYITTFYSFKGGVGRTMAMVNVATELVKSGRKVLIVDFDLEAPGLDTFDLVKRATPTSDGIVDFVIDYLITSKSPNIEDYVARCGISDELDGELWLMPAGNSLKDYQGRLAAIDWSKLYNENNGFLLFEDLKRQWNEYVLPDYVFIDSRTGHSDVSGICTRQLPDAISFFFFPNEQNLRGLENVVADVNDYSPKIKKHFVTSNVPDLDDEDLHLEKMLKRFSTSLGYSNLTSVIHRYSSLSLLNQSVFTYDRPNTRLSEEYRELSRNIVLNNLEDAEGAYEYLQTLVSRTPNENDDPVDIESKLDLIQGTHIHDSEILALLSIINERKGNYDEAYSFINKSIHYGKSEPSLLLRRARLASITFDLEQAKIDVLGVLTFKKVSFNDLSQAINLILIICPEKLSGITSSAALAYLAPLTLHRLIESVLFSSRENVTVAQLLLENRLRENKMKEEETHLLENQLALVYIARGQYEEALSKISPTYRPDENDSVEVVFNYAMAEWAINREPPNDLFKIIANVLSKRHLQDHNPNSIQCLSLSLWASGNKEDAMELAKQVRQQVSDSGSRNFSCWSFLTRGASGFSEDISEMIKLFNGEDILPSFIHPEVL